MKWNHLLFIPSLLLFACSAQEESGNRSETKEKPEIKNEERNITPDFPEGEYYFRGVIDHKYHFHMTFELKGNSITGTYYYDSQKKEIELTGQMIEGRLELDEKYRDKITGHFISDVLTPDSLSGTWKSTKGKTFAFALMPADRDEYFHALKDPEQTWTKEDFEKWASKFELKTLPFSYRPITDGDESLWFTPEEIRIFAVPDYNEEDDWMEYYSYYYGVRYETPDYIAIVYTESYLPGAFGIYNHSLMMATYTREGKMIDRNFLGCYCYDNNFYDYISTEENFTFENGKINVTGEEVYASHEWAAQDSMPVFEEIEPVKRSIGISTDGKFKN